MKIIIKFPGNTQRPVKGSKSELTVLSIFLCGFLTSAWLLGCRDREGRVGGGGDFVRPSATTGQKQEFRGHAKKETEMRVKIHARKGGMSRQEGPREWKVN